MRIWVFTELTLMALIFALTPFFVSGALGSISPISLVFLRFLIALLFQLPFIVRSGVRSLMPQKGDFTRVVMLGTFGMFAYHYLFIAAIGYTSPLNIAVIAATIPIIASLIASIKGLERLCIRRVCAMSVSFVGVLFVITGGDARVITDIEFNIGDIMMVAGALCMAWCNVGSKWLLTKYSPVTVTFFFTLVPTVLSLPLFVCEFGSIDWASHAVWAAALYSGIFATFLAVYFQQHAIKQIGVSKSIAFNNLIPVFSAVISVVILGASSVTVVQIISMCMIICGVLWNSRLKQ